MVAKVRRSFIALTLLTLCSCSTADQAPSEAERTEANNEVKSTMSHGNSKTPTTGDVTVSANDLARFAFNDLAANTKFRVSPCIHGATKGGNAENYCSLQNSKVFDSDGDGQLSGEIQTYSHIMVPTAPNEEYSPMREIDCTEEQECVIAVDTGDGQIVAFAEPLVTSQVPSAPRLTVGSAISSNIAGDSVFTIRVDGAGFEAGQRVDLVQCPKHKDSSTVDAAECLYDSGGSFTPTADGSFTGDMVVISKIKMNDGSQTTCDKPGACVLSYAWPNPGSRYVEAELIVKE